jgi:hydrogenase maturation factor
MQTKNSWHSTTTFSSGKVPPHILEKVVFPNCGIRLPSVLIGPSIGIDAAVISTVDHPAGLIAITSDPITGSIKDMGRLVVHVNANDLAVMGAIPAFLVLTILLPQGSEVTQLETIMKQVHQACLDLSISVIGGHTEVTGAVNQPIASGTMFGYIVRSISSANSEVGDRIVLTKTAGIEGTVIILSEKADELMLRGVFTREEIDASINELSSKVSVVKDAETAIKIPEVTAMHDPTEGGIANAIYEMTSASKKGFILDSDKINIREDTRRICDYYHISVLDLISSGTLLLTVKPTAVNQLLSKFKEAEIPAVDIGVIVEDETKHIINI